MLRFKTVWARDHYQLASGGRGGGLGATKRAQQGKAFKCWLAWLAAWETQWTSDCRQFQHLTGFEPMVSISQFFTCWIFIFWSDKIHSNSSTQNFDQHILFHEKSIGVGIFSLAHFCSMLIALVMNHRKVRAENFPFGTDLWEQVDNCWSITQRKMIFRGRLLKKKKTI